MLFYNRHYSFFLKFSQKQILVEDNTMKPNGTSLE